MSFLLLDASANCSANTYAGIMAAVLIIVVGIHQCLDRYYTHKERMHEITVAQFGENHADTKADD